MLSKLQAYTNPFYEALTIENQPKISTPNQLNRRICILTIDC